MPSGDFCADGLVIRSIPSGEHDKIVTLLTSGGRISVSAKGASSIRSRLMPACCPYVWANYEIHSKGDWYWMRDASVTESFPSIGKDIVSVYLAQYICEVLYELTSPSQDCEEVLRLGLNSLYALDASVRTPPVVKAVFELRAASLAGYRPELERCRGCGKVIDGAAFLDVMNGGLLCEECAARAPKLPPDAPRGSVPVDEFGTRSLLVPLTGAALSATRYCLEAPAKKMLSFVIPEGTDLNSFSRAAETYLLSHLERGFSSLKVYYEVL